jgi:hypothetical protein
MCKNSFHVVVCAMIWTEHGGMCNSLSAQRRIHDGSCGSHFSRSEHGDICSRINSKFHWSNNLCGVHCRGGHFRSCIHLTRKTLDFIKVSLSRLVFLVALIESGKKLHHRACDWDENISMSDLAIFLTINSRTAWSCATHRVYLGFRTFTSMPSLSLTVTSFSGATSDWWH